MGDPKRDPNLENYPYIQLDTTFNPKLLNPKP